MVNLAKKMGLWLSGGALVSGLAWYLQSSGSAQAQNDPDPGHAARCANRLSISFLGTSASSQMSSSSDPQALVETMLKDPAFVERFSRYINSQMNDAPGATSEEDGAYHLSKYVLQNDKPWKDLFSGPYNVTATGTGAAKTVSVVDDPNGLGYFRSQPWLLRYAGNELTGLKLNSAYRIPHNVVGLRLVATTNAPGADVSASGRQAAACRGCHYDGWYALDNTAQILSKVQRQGQTVTFTPADGQAKKVLGSYMLKDDKDLITTLVSSEQFAVHSCRLAFGYLYGRNENACEAKVFDACVDALKASGLIQDALASIAKDPSFCQ